MTFKEKSIFLLISFLLVCISLIYFPYHDMLSLPMDNLSLFAGEICVLDQLLQDSPKHDDHVL